MKVRARGKVNRYRLDGFDGKVVLQTWRMPDRQSLFRCIENNRHYLREWMSWLDATQSPEQLSSFLRSSIDGYRDGTCFRLGIRVEGEVSGCVSLEEINTFHGNAKVGYWLAADQQGQGIMTAAVRWIIRYGFEELGLATLGLRAAVDNKRSRRVAARVGMKLDGVLRQQEWLYDHHVDLAAYSLLRQEAS